MNLLAISGSARQASTNTALLRGLVAAAGDDHTVRLCPSVADLPVFTPDLEGDRLPAKVRAFAGLIDACDGIVISSPEYVHAIPGGLKNAIDWLVSRDEIIGKPIALLHGSHRGDDMLAQLRLVLSTVSDRFAPEIFERFDLIKQTPDDIAHRLAQPQDRQRLQGFLQAFTEFCNV